MGRGSSSRLDCSSTSLSGRQRFRSSPSHLSSLPATTGEGCGEESRTRWLGRLANVKTEFSVHADLGKSGRSVITCSESQRSKVRKLLDKTAVSRVFESIPFLHLFFGFHSRPFAPIAAWSSFRRRSLVVACLWIDKAFDWLNDALNNFQLKNKGKSGSDPVLGNQVPSPFYDQVPNETAANNSVYTPTVHGKFAPGQYPVQYCEVPNERNGKGPVSNLSDLCIIVDQW